MKKVLSLLFIAGTMSIVACGPSDEEKAKMEAESTAKMDSLFEAASQSMVEAADDVVTDTTKATPSESHEAH